MPLLKGKFRPATKVARSRTNSTSEGERSRSNSISDLDSPKIPTSGLKTISNALVTSQFSAFKVPAPPIVVGLPPSPHKAPSSPHKPPPPPSSSLFHASPRKTPTLSPRILSPHYIEPPSTHSEGEEDDEDRFDALNLSKPEPIHTESFPPIPPVDTSQQHKQGDSDVLVDVFKSERTDDVVKLDEGYTAVNRDPVSTVRQDTVPQQSAVSEGIGIESDADYSDVVSVTSQVSDRSERARKPTIPLVIDKATTTMADVIKMRPSKKGNENPLTEIWKEIKRKRQRDEQICLEKEQSRKDRIQQLIEEAESMGQTLEEGDVDEAELPPLEVEVNPETGAIVVNEKSLEVNMKTETDIQETVVEDVSEISFGKYEDHNVNINSFSRRKPKKITTWTALENERFYLALRKVGTDFELMHKIMPEYTRDQLKRKFKREEKTRLSKVDLALSYSMRIDDNIIAKEPEPPKKVKKEESKPRKRSKREQSKCTPAASTKSDRKDENEREEGGITQPPVKPACKQNKVTALDTDQTILSVVEEEERLVPRKREKRKSRPLVIDDDDEDCKVIL